MTLTIIINYCSYVTVYYYYPLNYVLQYFLFSYSWWLCMASNISVQYNGGLLPDIILQCLPKVTTIGEPV